MNQITDSTRRCKSCTKNPRMIRFGGKDLVYSSVSPFWGSDAREMWDYIEKK